MGKGSVPTEALGTPGMYTGNLKGTGLGQATQQKTTSQGGAQQVETLRQGTLPKAEAVRQVTIDGSCQKSALKAWQASNGDASRKAVPEGTKD